MTTASQLLRENLGWLQKRCHREALRLRSVDVAELAQELVQAAAIEFIEKAPKWFAQPTRESLQGQARTLLAMALQHQRTDYIENVNRFRSPDVDREEDEGSHDPGASRAGVAGGDDEMVQNLSRGAEAAGLWQAIEALQIVRRLYLLAVHFPSRVSLLLVGEAAGYRRGGGSPVARPVDQAWALLELKRRDEDLIDDGPAWKRTIAEILRSPKPLGAISPSELKTALDSVDQYLKRARDDLKTLLAQAET